MTGDKIVITRPVFLPLMSPYMPVRRAGRFHIQVKENEVTLGEFKRVIRHFHMLDAALPAGTYKRFTLACPAVAAKIRPIETASRALKEPARSMTIFRTPFCQRLTAIGLGDLADFIYDNETQISTGLRRNSAVRED